MLDFSKIYTALGAAGQPQPPHEFVVGDLGSVSFDEDGCVARLVMAEQSLAGDQARAVKESPECSLPSYISVSPSGRICYHLIADGDEDQTDAMLAALNALVSELSGQRG